MKGQRERFGWLDAAKGMGIILVVIGHVWTRGPVRDAIYAFHMPLFFLLGGFFARPRQMRDFAIGQWRSLAVPYFAFLLVLMAADPIIEQARGHEPIFRSWDAALWAMLLGGTELRGPFTIFWFVPCLMVARIAQNGLSLLWPDPRDWRWAAAMTASLAVGMWAGQVSDFSPLGLLSVPVALTLLWLGALWAALEDDHWLLAIAVAGALLLILSGRLVPLNMKIGDYGVPAWSLPAALVLSLGLCWLARIMPWRWLQALGRMSLVIMFLHVPVIHYLAPYFSKPTLLGAALALPILAFLAVERVGWGRRYFLGSRVS